MTPKELKAEVARLNRLLSVAAKLAARQMTTIDKLTAAQLRVQHLMQKLKGVK